VVALHFLFPSRHDNCEYVHYILVHFGSAKATEGTHQSPSILNQNMLCIIVKLEEKGEGQNTNFTPCSNGMLPKLLPQAVGLFLLQYKNNFFYYLCDCKFM
jgi:hypothetical protein